MKTAKQERPITIDAPPDITTAAARDEWAATEDARQTAIKYASAWPGIVAVESCRLETTGFGRGTGRHFAFFRVVVVQQVVERPSDGEHTVIRAGRLD